MRSRRYLSILALVATLALVLAACGGSEETSPSDAESDAAAGDTSSEAVDPAVPATDLGLINEGTLAVCTDSPYQPFEFEEDGEFKGFDVELVTAIAEGLGVTAQFQVTPFDAIQSGAALNARQCDLAASAMTITEERSEGLNFSDPYFDADQSLMVPQDAAGTTLDQLSGERIGVQASTTGQRYAEENAPDDVEIVEYPDSSALFQAIQGGEIAAVLQDFPVNAYFATQDDSVTVVEQYATGEQYGFAAQKDNTALVDGINEQLTTLRDDGTYDDIFSTWFGEAPGGSSEASGPSESAS